jgi:hypothetical protein
MHRLLKSLHTRRVSAVYSSAIFRDVIPEDVHVNLTHIVTVLIPRHVSLQFAPSSGGCNLLCL